MVTFLQMKHGLEQISVPLPGADLRIRLDDLLESYELLESHTKVSLCIDNAVRFLDLHDATPLNVRSFLRHYLSIIAQAL